MIVSNLCKQIDDKKILDGVSFVVSDNDKIGLVGTNGVGKSTLLKILSKELEFDLGKINYEGKTIAYLKQEISNDFNDLTICQFVKKECGIDILELEIKELENKLCDSNMDQYNNLLNKYLLLDGYSFEYKLESILNGLNLKKNINVKVGKLSGGEKIKILLSILILKNGDILLLDEPTNNLDSDAINWLEGYLKSIKKTIIVVSHDEIFLNNIVNKVWELKNGNIFQYNIGYEDYLKQKNREYEQSKFEYIKSIEQRDKIKKQIQIAKEWTNKGNNKKTYNDNDKIANNYAKERTNFGNISKLTSELKNLEIPEFEEKKPLDIFFNFDEEKSNKDIFLDNISIGYNKNILCKNLNLIIPFGSSVNIVGSNGSGKSTLLKTILGIINPISGIVNIGSGVRFGYISQNTLEENIDESIYSYLVYGINNIDKSKVFMLMDKIGINYEDKDKLYSTLSPGERTRVNIAKLALNNVNVLILDEVTNHLDSEALELIYELIRVFKGTIISVSHNRKYNEILNPNITFNLNKDVNKDFK